MPNFPRLALALALLACGMLAAPAVAAGPVKFSGKTKVGKRPVTFKVKGKFVRGFAGGVNVVCIQGPVEFDAVVPPKALKIKRGGKFSYKGLDKPGSSQIKLSGTIKGKRASGKLQMSYSRYSVVSGSWQPCLGSTKWTARAK